MKKEQKKALEMLTEQALSHERQLACLEDLRIEDLSVDLIIYAVQLLRGHMHAVDLQGEHIVDLCGTGGDKSGTFNISTTASFVVAGAGIPLAKHGSVSITSKSGSMDLLAALGTNVSKSPGQAKAQFEKTQMCFLFAPYFHPAFAKFAEARKELAAKGQLTLFNILGPLLNPALVKRMAMGVFKPDLVFLLTEVLKETGTEKALVFSGSGLDEMMLSDENTIYEIKDGLIKPFDFRLRNFDFLPCTLEELKGGTPEENAKITRDILNGQEQGPKKHIVVLNAAAAIYTARDDLDFKAAIDMARDSLESGKALKKLEMCGP